ncbi:hypothetical protein [Mycobacterium sp. 852014-52144_SCH5372336]|uniref:hypothetical protein n=1 Tax=Mycobacterium sp. 852014-52144_SCH5372336 TaxID=1834115 RepID=UPI0007FE1F3C|nr:hypothetical protein [Mycobacterium sp. 852014-52144_SCH5372336]OBB76354.1 hypothetical protein A5759_06015 [Mycobacterium sp. 852014-52144_SCH5372336]
MTVTDVAKKVSGWQTLRPERLEAMTADRITVLFNLYGYRTLDVDAVRDNDLLDVRAASSPA